MHELEVNGQDERDGAKHGADDEAEGVEFEADA